MWFENPQFTRSVLRDDLQESMNFSGPSEQPAMFPTDSAPNRRFVVFVLLTPRFKSVDDAWAGNFWAEWSRISGVKRGRNGESRSVSSGPKAQGQ